MSKYAQKFDGNGLPIPTEMITSLKRVDVSLSANLTNFTVAVPSGAYGVIVKKAPIGFEGKFNGGDSIPLAEGDVFSPFINGISTLTVTTTSTNASPIIFIFIV